MKSYSWGVRVKCILGALFFVFLGVFLKRFHSKDPKDCKIRQLFKRFFSKNVEEKKEEGKKEEEKKKKGIALLVSGAPASGKGTQCEKIRAKIVGIVHLSTGDILRQAVKDKTELGLKAKEYMDGGNLVPDDLVLSLVKGRLLEKDCQEFGYILDGFPRTEVQAKWLIDNGLVPDAVINMVVPDEELLKRVVGRRTDSETGKIYNLNFEDAMPPSDIPESRLIHRSDDTMEKIVPRLKAFHANEQLLVLFGDKVHNIDGTKGSSNSWRQIEKVLDDTLKTL